MKNDPSHQMWSKLETTEQNFDGIENALVKGYLRTLDEREAHAVKSRMEIFGHAEMRMNELIRRGNFIERGVSKPLRLVRILKIRSRTVDKAMEALERIERAKVRLYEREADAEKTLLELEIFPLVRSGSDYFAFTPKVSKSLAEKYADEMGFVHPKALENLIWISDLARGEVSMEMENIP